MINRLANLISHTKQEVSDAFVAMTVVLIESSKKNATKEEFASSISELGFDQAKCDALILAYTENSSSIRDSLVACSDLDGRFQSMSWRLDIELASRSVRNLNRPVYMIDIKTKQKLSNEQTMTTESHLFNTDYATLAYITEELERAVKESKTVHARRITRYVK